ncbi:MAG: hypothetical protein ACIAXF_17255, partial [Phycisphaerales bacterium JB063]
MPQPIAPLRCLLLAFLLVAIPITPVLAKTTDLAPDKNAATAQPRLDHYVLVPASPYVRDDPDTALPLDPTIIPFNNWQFRGPDGEWQPWRRRSRLYQSHATGQEAVDAPVMPVLSMYWTLPKTLQLDYAEIGPATRASQTFFSHGVRNSRHVTADHSFYQLGINIGNVSDLPDQLDLRIRFSHGEWETIATADLDSDFPVGDDQMSIQYLGAPRPDFPAMVFVRERAKNLEDDVIFDTHFTLEIQTIGDFRGSDTHHRLQAYDRN